MVVRQVAWWIGPDRGRPNDPESMMVEIQDEGRGMFVAISDRYGTQVGIDVGKWPYLKNAIEEAICHIKEWEEDAEVIRTT